MIYKIVTKNDLKKIKPFFNEIRFFMGNSVLDGVMGEAYVDDISNPRIAFLTVRRYCFMSGNIEDDALEKIINENFKNYRLIPNDELAKKIEKIYGNNIKRGQRHSMKKNVIFDLNKLNEMSQKLAKEFALVPIDEELANRIKKQKFVTITDDYKKYGIGFCCMHHNKIIGVASSNIFYKDGIEVTIKVDEKYRRRGIATVMASKLILECLSKNKKVSWNAQTIGSVALAQKLGFEYDSSYNVYRFD